MHNLRLVTVLALSSFSAFATAPVSVPAPLSTPIQEITEQTCGGPTLAPVVPILPPAAVTGRADFYLAEVNPVSGATLQALSYGHPDVVHPIASTWKGPLIYAVMRDVDAGRLSLNTSYLTTAANRSIEAYPPGRNTLKALAERAIKHSDNTAADILLLGYGPQRFSNWVHQQSPCTQILLTTKATWAAQGGLLSKQLGPDVVTGSAAYAALPWADRVRQAGELIKGAQQVTGPKVFTAVNQWFTSSQYTPQVDLNLQPTSTARAYTDLIAKLYSGNGLQGSKTVYRDIMATGCCRPRQPRLTTSYWAAKAGSGWRILTLTGYVELPNGRRFAFAFFDDLAHDGDTDLLEPQLKYIVNWVEQLISNLPST